MRRHSILRGRATVAVLVVGLVIAGLAASVSALAGRPEAIRLAANQVALRCHNGLVPAESDQGGDPGSTDCSRLGGIETFHDLFTSTTELGARETAPFATQASGAYLHAVSQSRAMPLATVASGAGNRWKLAGHSPLCAAQTSGNTACPAAN